MMIPGANLLKIALSRLGRQTVFYRQFLGNIENAAGIDAPQYASPVAAQGSVQPLSRQAVMQNGLDETRRYVTFYTFTAMNEVARDTAGDRFTWNGRTWEVTDSTDWHALDGWKGVLAVDVGIEIPFIAPFWGFDTDHANFDNGNFYAGQ